MTDEELIEEKLAHIQVKLDDNLKDDVRYLIKQVRDLQLIRDKKSAELTQLKVEKGRLEAINKQLKGETEDLKSKLRAAEKQLKKEQLND